MVELAISCGNVFMYAMQDTQILNPISQFVIPTETT